jgi:hypothetical protein
MKPQKYPKSRIVKGSILYEASVDESDEGGLQLCVREHEITAICKGKGKDDGKKKIQYVYLVWRCAGMTWGKLSSKHGHYGWTNAIQDWMRKRFPVGDDLPTGLYTTKLAALRYAKHQQVTNRARFQKWAIDEKTSHDDIIAVIDKKLAIIERAITRAKSFSSAKSRLLASPSCAP